MGRRRRMKEEDEDEDEEEEAGEVEKFDCPWNFIIQRSMGP